MKCWQIFKIGNINYQRKKRKYLSKNKNINSKKNKGILIAKKRTILSNYFVFI